MVDKEIKDQVMSVLPKDAEVSKIELLGPEIYIYTKNIKLFYETDKYISELAFLLKKRVNIRADSSILKEPDLAKKSILESIPSDAKVSAIYFDSYFSEVVIEAFKPGLVIGKGGMTTKKIINDTGWTPNIIRAPANECKILGQIRSTIYK
jgi:predicted metal-dependent RNase